MNLKQISVRNLDLVKSDKLSVCQKYTTEELLFESLSCCMTKKGTIKFFEGFSEDMTMRNNNDICTLNFANKNKPGINFPNSGRTQEEQLLRKFPNLFFALMSIKYPIENNEIIVTDYVQMICDNEYKIIDVDQRRCSMFVTIPAPDHYTEKFDFELVMNKIKNIIMAPIHFKLKQSNIKYLPKKLILGAWGCGAFLPTKSIFSKILKNIPKELQNCETYQELIANMFYHILINLEFAKFYDEIIFAIPKNDINYDMFARVFKKVIH